MPEVTQSWTVRSLLAWARGWLERKGVQSPRLDAELLLAHALQCDRLRLYVDHDKPLSPEELLRVKPLLQRRAEREPVAYILGVKEFYGRPFAVGPGVFIPRPETELLVQHALLALSATGEGQEALDLCAGAGPVGVSLAAERPGLSVTLVELSPEAAKFTEANALRHAGARARVLEGNLFAPLGEPRERFDVLVANPPYIPRDDAGQLEPDILRHEPPLALFGGKDGLDVLRELIAKAPLWMRPGAFFGVELDPPQAPEVVALCTSAGLVSAHAIDDLAHLPRFVIARKP